MHNDSPAVQDEFGRRPFAAQLARALSAPRHGAGGFVVALDGEWGSGKTTMLYWVKEELGKLDPAPVVLDFNPWRISGLDALIETFLIELAAKLEEIRTVFPASISNAFGSSSPSRRSSKPSCFR